MPPSDKPGDFAAAETVRLHFPGLSRSVVAPVHVLRRPATAAAMREAATDGPHETTFLWPSPGHAESGPTGPGAAPSCAVRWYTPAGTTRLCGTGALAATACVAPPYAGRSHPPAEAAHCLFETGHATLHGRREGAGHVAVRLPRGHAVPFEVPASLRRALRLDEPVVRAAVSESLGLAALHLPSRDAVAALAPCWDALRDVRRGSVGAVIVTAPSGGRFDVVYRYFTPWHGKNESEAAGSALALLGPFWSERLGREALRCHQLSPSGASFRACVEAEGTWIGVDAATKGTRDS